VDAGRAVELVSLPPVTATPEGRPTQQGMERTLHLLLFKKVGAAADMGLRRAEVRDGNVVYGPVEPKQFQAGQTVALLVHGFLSDSGWMVEHSPGYLQTEARAYDHVLTWDYETFGTGVEENGRNLALALGQQCGFGPDDGVTVHVYAHSMGTIVTRCMIELSGGHAFVDRAVLAGPPNRGTTLATSSRGLLFLVDQLLNGSWPIPVLGSGNWTLTQLYDQGVGLADLAVDAPLLNKLNALEAPANVPYLVLAGECVPASEESNRLNRLAHKVLDQELAAFFGEPNDQVIGLSSQKSVRGGTYPALTTSVLACDHFSYFAAPEGRQAIKSWMA
jgi:pimeloyl-ACP methyl ester carboxylesterase